MTDCDFLVEFVTEIPLKFEPPQKESAVRPDVVINKRITEKKRSDEKIKMSNHFTETKRVDEKTIVSNHFRELCYCVRHRNYSELEQRINNPNAIISIPIDHVDKLGNTLLIISCQNGNTKIAKLCLRRGANVNKQNVNGQTCLHYAFRYGFGKFTAIFFRQIFWLALIFF